MNPYRQFLIDNGSLIPVEQQAKRPCLELDALGHHQAAWHIREHFDAVARGMECGIPLDQIPEYVTDAWGKRDRKKGVRLAA